MRRLRIVAGVMNPKTKWPCEAVRSELKASPGSNPGRPNENKGGVLNKIKIVVQFLIILFSCFFIMFFTIYGVVHFYLSHIK